MRRLLVINPNTTGSVSALLQHHVQRAAGPDIRVQTVGARFGAPYIACEASYAVAGHALLDAWAADRSAHPQDPADAVLIGCFGDPGLWALREISTVPVSGLAEASFFQARQSGRFAIVTGGARWKPMLERLAGALGYADVLGGVHTVAPSGVELANHPEHALALLTHACEEAARDTSIRAIVLGGAGLAGMAALVQPRIQVPVIDSVLAGTRYVLDLPALSATPHPKTVDWVHLSAEMCAWA